MFRALLVIAAIVGPLVASHAPIKAPLQAETYVVSTMPGHVTGLTTA
ncbi:hypothetical protein NKH69_05765 [Mesorhizobium sp. M0976]